MGRSSAGRVTEGRVLLVAAFGAFLAFLDATIVNVAFPSIRESFGGTSIGELSWVLNAYNIVFAAFLIVFGRIADLLGRRRVFTAGVVVFTVASALCGAATGVELLVGARVLQALGAAMLVPASLALVVAAFPSERRAHAIGLWGATAAVASGLGPPIGGALVEMGGWRWAFLVNIPFGVAAVIAARSQLVESRAPGRRRVPDLLGAALLASAVAALTLGIVKGNDWGWTSPGLVASFVSAVVFAALFSLSSARHRSPLLDPTLLRIPPFAVANIATALAGLGFYAYLLTNVLWLQYVWGYSVLRAGLALVPGALVAAIAAAVLGPVAARRGYRVVVVPGALVWAGAYLWYYQSVGPEPEFLSEWLAGQVLSGIGVGATLPVLGSAALAAVPGGRYATASAVVSSARQLGGVFGLALLVVVIGTPTATGAVSAFRHGWILSIVAFLAVAVLALPLGRLDHAVAEEQSDPRDEPVVHLPGPGAPSPGAPAAIDTASLDGIPLITALSTSARTRLELAAEEIALPAGDWLMREGDPPGSVYVLRSGRLEVHIAGAVVRELGPGAVIGELAMLTGESRSAGVRARRDSTLLELHREDFSALLDSDRAAARVVVTQLAERLREDRPMMSQPAVAPRVIAFVGVHDGAPVERVAQTVLSGLQQHLRSVAPGKVDADGLARAERHHERVVLIATTDDPLWREACLRQADQVLLVASSDARPSAGTAPAKQPELVLIGPAPGAAALTAWCAATDAWQVTVVSNSDDLAAGLRPVVARTSGRSLGLVLAGGGARAFAHVGVLRELEEAGLHVDRVAGSSIGAIVAAAWATGVTGEELEALCYDEFVRRRPFSDYTVPIHALARGERKRAGLVRAFGADTVIEGLPRQFQCVSTDLVSRTRQVHRRGGLVDAALASVRLPVLFPPIPDGQRLLIDGGVLDNLPVDLLTERAEGPVVAVNIAMGGSVRPRPTAAGPSSAPWPLRPARIPTLGETLLRTMMIGSAGAVAAARDLGAWVVTPATLGVGLLEFHQLDRMVQAGRGAARALLALMEQEDAGRPGLRPDTGVPEQADPSRVRGQATRPR